MIQFTLDDKQEARLRKWQKHHDCKCREEGFGRYAGSIGGADKFIFIPTSIGCITKVRCVCGKEIDFSDIN